MLKLFTSISDLKFWEALVLLMYKGFEEQGKKLENDFFFCRKSRAIMQVNLSKYWRLNAKECLFKSKSMTPNYIIQGNSKYMKLDTPLQKTNADPWNLVYKISLFNLIYAVLHSSFSFVKHKKCLSVLPEYLEIIWFRLLLPFYWTEFFGQRISRTVL